MKKVFNFFKCLSVSMAIFLIVIPNALAFVYVSNVDSDNVSVIDPATHSVVTTIAVGNEPRNLASNPSGTRIYVPNRHSDTVSVINTSTNTVIATVDIDASIDDEPYAIAVTPDGSEAWVANKKGGGSTTGSVTIINTATNTVSDTIDHVDFSSCEGIAMNPVSARAYVVNKSGGTVTIVNTDNRQIITTVTVGSEPRYAVVTPDGAFVYVSVMETDVVAAKIDTSTNTVSTITRTGSGYWRRNMAITPSGSKVYVAGQNDYLVVINTSNDATSAITFNNLYYTYGVALVPESNIGYVTDEYSVFAFDTSTDTEITGASLPITAGTTPRAIAAQRDPSSIPTLNEWGMIILSLFMTLSAVWFWRRRTNIS